MLYSSQKDLHKNKMFKLISEALRQSVKFFTETGSYLHFGITNEPHRIKICGVPHSHNKLTTLITSPIENTSVAQP